MRPVWLIESDVYGDEATALLAEIRQQGMPADLVPYQSLKQGASLVVNGQPLTPDLRKIGSWRRRDASV